MRILVIDDDPALRELTRLILHNAGYETDSAGNGRKGLQMLSHQEYALVVTDMLMPEMEGLQLMLECRHHHPDMKFIAVSGGYSRGAFDALPAAHAMGALETLYKPFSTEELLAAVRRAIGPPSDSAPASPER
jgi:DNA-binding NtrC family response regulator